MFNNEGKVGVLDGLAGTYTNETLGSLVLDGKGSGKLGDTAITYVVNEDKTLTVTAGEKTYIVTLGAGTYTYKEKVESAIPAWLAGKAFIGTDAIQAYNEDYEEYSYENVGIVFSAKAMTLSTSAGYGVSTTTPLAGSYRKNTDAPYTIDGTTLKVTLNDVAVQIELDEENNTFHFANADTVDGFTLRRSVKFKVVA